MSDKSSSAFSASSSAASCPANDDSVVSSDVTKSYAEAGVNIKQTDQLLQYITPVAAATHTTGVMNSLGSFGAMFDLAALNYKDPILVSGADGVGTKLKLAVSMNKHDTIGLDLVAMCVNDLLAHGATPLFFLDYFACSKLDTKVAKIVIEGIANGCKRVGCALIGGETAEMPGMYADGEYDLAGFCVGAVERDAIIDSQKVKAGDVLLGIASSGPHANGYSLIRKLIGNNFKEQVAGRSLGEILLEPTRIYVRPVLRLLQKCRVNAIAHITGGGLRDNIPRVIPKYLQAVIDVRTWQWPEIFYWIQKQGKISDQEMYHTFNCGVGMVICVPEDDKNIALELLNEYGENAWEIGSVRPQGKQDEGIYFTAF